MKSAFLSLVFLVVALLPQGARAQVVDEELPPGMAPDEERTDYLLGPEDEGPPQPPRVVLTATGGSGIRIIQDLDLSQERFTPGFVDLFGAFVFGSTSTWRHGVGLGLSTNISGDGAAQGVDGFDQLVVAPTYAGYFRFGMDLVVMAKFGVPLGLVLNEIGGFVPGAELTGGLAYFLTSGLAAYGEVGASAWLGTGSRIHPIVTAELGLLIDYEVLP